MQTLPPPAPVNLPPGGDPFGTSDAAARVRAADWSQTPLGPMNSWPQSLRVAVGICLNSRFPMFVWWGPDLVNIYNDAYVPVLGKRHPAALGRPARAIWGDIWDVIGPQADAVMRRGEATWNDRVLLVMERNGYAEDTWFTWSYSPIPDDAGGIGGLFCACTEETGRVAAERERDRLAGQRQLALDAARMGWWHYDPVTKVATWDERYKEIFGVTGHTRPNEEILRRLHPDDLPGVWAAVEAALDPVDPKPYAAEYRVVHDDGSVRWVEAHGTATFEGEGAARRAVSFVGTVADVTDRRRARDQSRAILESVTDAFFALDRDWRFTYANRHADHILGRTPGDLIGKSLWEEYPGLRGNEIERAYHRAVSEQVAVSVTSYYPDHDRWYEVHAYPAPDGLSVYFRDATERKRAEAALRESEERFRAAFDQSAVGIVFGDLDGYVHRANDAFCRLVGRPREDILGRTTVGYTHPDDTARNVEVVAWIRAPEGGALAYDKRYVRPDGSTVHARVSVTAVRDAGGEPVGAVVVVQDETDRRRAAEALAASERRFRFLSELGELTRDLADPEGVMEAVAEHLGRHLRASRCAYADVEPDADRFTIRHDYTDGCPSTVGEYRLDLFGPRAAADQRAGRTLVVADVDAELGPGGGAEMFSAIGIKAVVCCPLVRAGRLVAMMAVHQTTPRAWTADEVGLVEAVVERSWAYVERARVARALRQSEENLRRLADAMPQIVWTAGPDGVVDYFNRRWSEYAAAPAGGAGWESSVHPDDRPRAAGEWAASVQSGEPFVAEFRVRGGEGRYRWFLARALPVRDPAGRAGRWYGTFTDVHDQKGLQAENEQLLASERAARTEAERHGRMKDEFLATLGHELRTPLNAILGWSHLLAGGVRDEADLAEGLGTIERNARAQAQIIEDLLDMSGIVAGKIRLDVRRLDLRAVVEAAAQTVRLAADAKGVRLQTVLDPTGAAVSGDPDRLQQVFWNLLSNAVKFSPRGNAVKVVLGRVDSHVEVAVADAGEGIRADFLPFVFDRFRQADASSTRRHGGLGLGLSIAKQLVELHGGSIRAESPGEGKGATFTVSLPLSAVHPDPAPAEGPRHPTARPDHGARPETCLKLRGVTVLVVDNEPDARALVRRLLEDCEARVVTAGSAAEALAAVRTERPGVLVSDIGMPGEDGYALLKQVRALGPAAGGNLPAVALTAYARADDRMRAVVAGFDFHVAKPVEPAELITVVASLAARGGRG